MQAMGSWPLLPLSLLSFLFCPDPSLAFSLKHCTIGYPENLINVSISCSNRYLLMIPDDIPKNTTSLDLSSNQIWNITTTDLRGLSGLIILEASRNLLSHIDDGAFTDLAMLNVLILSANRFTELTRNMFLGLSNLVRLYLDMNHISHINSLTFRPLVNIKEVILSTNSLRHITDIAPLFKLPSLHILDLSNNWLNICFQLDDLHLNVSNLRVLDLSMTQLKKFSIKKDIFPHLQTLRLLNSGDDMKWDVSNKMFLRSLTTLLVSGTSITFESYTAMLQTADSLRELRLSFVEEFIPKGLIDIGCQIRSVRTLDLNYAVIHTVDDNLLRSCSQLTKLILSFNYLPDISEHSLTSLTKLRHLELDYNYLSKVPLALRGLSTLEKLNLNVNLIMELDCLDFQNLTRLTSLSLNNNHISKLQGCVFESLNNLKVLNIKKNSIFVFDNTFRVNLWKLESLDLRKNGLLKITRGEFRNLSSLRFLDLESNIHYDLSDWAFEGLNNLRTMVVSLANYYNDPFKGLTQLENLTLHLHQNWMRRNPQQNAEPPFYYLPNLKTLVLKAHDKKPHFCEPELFVGLKSLESFVADKFFNCIQSIHPDTFKYTPKLMNLQMIHCNLSYLNPALFWPIPNLQALDLSNNNFKSLDFLVQANMQALRWFKFSGNKLSIINEKVFDSLPALRYLDLNDNTLICECSNSGFYKWVLSNNEVQVVDGHQYNCAFPASKQGTKFLDFDINSCWVDVSFLCFISSSSLVLLILLTSFIYHFLRWHLTYAYYLFLGFLYDKKKKRGTPHQFDAFVSYNIHNEDWVYEELLPELEGQQGWRLCLHHRDFEPGKPIVENITDAIYGSRKTICVISQQYLQSEWCSKEIQMASFRLFDEQEDVLILLFLEDIPSWQLTVYYRIRSLVKKFTYLSWPKAGQHTGVFWMNMRRALETDTS